MSTPDGRTNKPATAARIYDLYLGGNHNFPADQAAAAAITAMFPTIPALARNNRRFLRRAVQYVAETGVAQFLDIGSGIPTEGTVHQIVQAVNPDATVVYVDNDPVAVSEGREILEGNHHATAIYGDLTDPDSILANPDLNRLIDFTQPVGLLLVAVLHFIPDDDQAETIVRRLLARLAPGSYLVMSHGASDHAEPPDTSLLDRAKDVYRTSTATPFHLRTQSHMRDFFTGLELVDPGISWVTQWRPNPADPSEAIDDPTATAALVAVAKLP